MAETPVWMQTLTEKHQNQIASHEARFGKLGELQTSEQKKLLKETVSRMKTEGK